MERAVPAWRPRTMEPVSSDCVVLAHQLQHETACRHLFNRIHIGYYRQMTQSKPNSRMRWMRINTKTVCHILQKIDSVVPDDRRGVFVRCLASVMLAPVEIPRDIEV